MTAERFTFPVPGPHPGAPSAWSAQSASSDCRRWSAAQPPCRLLADEWAPIDLDGWNRALHRAGVPLRLRGAGPDGGVVDSGAAHLSRADLWAAGRRAVRSPQEAVVALYMCHAWRHGRLAAVAGDLGSAAIGRAPDVPGTPVLPVTTAGVPVGSGTAAEESPAGAETLRWAASTVGRDPRRALRRLTLGTGAAVGVRLELGTAVVFLAACAGPTGGAGLPEVEEHVLDALAALTGTGWGRADDLGTEGYLRYVRALERWCPGVDPRTVVAWAEASARLTRRGAVS